MNCTVCSNALYCTIFQWSSKREDNGTDNHGMRIFTKSVSSYDIEKSSVRSQYEASNLS